MTDVRDRVRKLKALADDPAAAPGEAQNAREAAQRLMDQNGLKDGDIPKEQAADDWRSYRHAGWDFGGYSAWSFLNDFLKDYRGDWFRPETPEEAKARKAREARAARAEKKRQKRIWEDDPSGYSARALEEFISEVREEWEYPEEKTDKDAAERWIVLLQAWLRKKSEEAA